MRVRAAEAFGASWIIAVAKGCGTRGSGVPDDRKIPSL
jgi:hypothetical protein